MITTNTLLAAAFLSLTPSAFAFDLPGLSGNSGVAMPAANPPLLYGAGISGPAEQDLAALQAEALTDPGRFIDSHTPGEVALAFGLPAGHRYVISNAKAQLAVVRIRVNLTTQRLTVEGPEVNKIFRISSGLAPKYATPGSGKCFAPDFIEAMHYSSLYNKAPMPNSIFYNGNIAIHGTEAEWLLGKPASHGCIRLSKANAKTLYDVVKANGKSNASICVEGKTPAQ